MGMRIPSVRDAAWPDPPLPGGRGGVYPPLYSSIIGKIQHTTLLLSVLPISSAKYPTCGPQGTATPTVVLVDAARFISCAAACPGVGNGASPGYQPGRVPVGKREWPRLGSRDPPCAAPGRHPPHVTGWNMRMSVPVTCACETP